MIYSMTGYAVAARELAFGVLNVELRSVNHRYLDVQFRLPDDLRAIESQLREMLTARLARGKVECRVTFTAAAGAQQLPEINETLLRQLIALDGRVRAGFPQAASLNVADVLRWPGMLGAEVLPLEELQTACRELLQRVAKTYAVDPRILVSIWGLESNFGRFAGVRPTIPTLATLAYDPRRSARFRAELFSALEILNRGDLKPEQMTAWDAFAKASDAADVKDTARCNALPSEMKERPNYVDRLGMEEAYMKARVERIEEPVDDPLCRPWRVTGDVPLDLQQHLGPITVLADRQARSHFPADT